MKSRLNEAENKTVKHKKTQNNNSWNPKSQVNQYHKKILTFNKNKTNPLIKIAPFYHPKKIKKNMGQF